MYGFKTFLSLILTTLLFMNNNYSQQDNDYVLPEELKDLMTKNSEYINRKLDFYNINFKEIKPLFIIEELNSSNFEGELKMNMLGNNFIAIDTFDNVIKYLYDLFPKKNLILPAIDKRRLIKVVNIHTGKSKIEVLNEVISKFNLNLKSFNKFNKVLCVDFCSYKNLESEIPPIDLKFNYMNIDETDSNLFLKDMDSISLGYFYSFYTDKQISIKTSYNCGIIKLMRLNKYNLDDLDSQLISKFQISTYRNVEEKWIQLYR